ncbi:hypothetical protein LRR81_08065 [Metabacillus sp. GX 13764]|uniref:hypothetical protein n=1 Tax=Metabacillus kandeliae TaxID=2900151 RepID=UPI001E55E40E|nr:hypothetical protein [Metabacillus kandeliae]MCD7034186.1 hypothetical protein [Metabacillus kandeliae]
MDGVTWAVIICMILAGGAWIWYYVALGYRIAREEREAGRDLTHEINPFSGSAKGPEKKKRK